MVLCTVLPYVKASEGGDVGCDKMSMSNVRKSFLHGSTALAGLGLLNVEVSRLHSDTPHSVGLLRTRDGSDAETST